VKNSKSCFIAIEGIDGSGKSTQIQELSNWLPTSGLMPKDSNLIITKEPGGTLFGQEIRNLLLSHQTKIKPDRIAELLLYFADRAQHISEVIKPALNKNDWVISDRFSGSTLAYQGYGRDLDKNLIINLEKIVCGETQPDITLWLDISEEESIYRRKHITNDRIEAEGIHFLKKVNKGFSIIAKERNWERICANQDPSDVSISIKRLLNKLLANQ
tara:strand:+ start:7897 stop:8541 length:645 start_codon:yes stop_codon:yes gene_type:complete